MASKVSKSTTTIALFFALNLIFFSLVSACDECPKPKPKPKPACPPPPYVPKKACPTDTLKLGACANLLGGLIGVIIGTPPSKPCCTVIEGLVDLEAAVCLCTAIKANILGINLNVPLSLSLLLNACGKKVPEGFKCA